MESGAVRVEVSYERRWQLSVARAGLAAVRQVRLWSEGAAPLRGLELELSWSGGLAAAVRVPVELLEAGASLVLTGAELQPTWPLKRLASQETTEVATFGVKLVRKANGSEAAAVLYDAALPLEVLAFDAWPGTEAAAELLAAFVTPEHAGMQEWATKAGLSEQAGYRGLDAAGVRGCGAAALGVLAGRELGRVEAGAARITSAGALLAGAEGTALAGALAAAGALEAAGLAPLVGVSGAQALLGLWLQDRSLPTVWTDDPGVLRRRVEQGELAVWEVGAAAARGAAQGEEAGRAALVRLEGFGPVVDVRAARASRVEPLPLVQGEVGATGAALAPAVALPGAARLEGWKHKLLDLSSRNRLLNLKDGKATLPLEATAAALEDALHEHGRLELRSRAAAPTEERDPEAQEAARRRGLGAGTLTVKLGEKEFEKRVVELYRTGQSFMQETGSCPMYLAAGMLRWFEAAGSKVERLAPVLLVPVTIERDSTRGPYRLVLADDEAMINSTLLKKLEADFGVQLSGLDPLPEDEAGLDVPAILAQVQAAVQPLGFEVLLDAAVSIFSFQKLLMWQDLERSHAALLKSPVVQHILGATPGGGGFPLAAPLPRIERLDDDRPTSGDLSVVDADSSQLGAIYAALDGNSFVLQGPPGTGKSQTITNLIAQALGQGKTVLFVSEKRAALEVVEQRLGRAGLGPFTLEVHSDKASKAEILRQLQEPLQFAWGGQDAADADWGRAATELAALRSQLNQHARRIHAPGPFGESIYQATARLIGQREVPFVELKQQAAPSRERLDALRVAARELTATAGRAGALPDHPWRGVRHVNWGAPWQREAETKRTAAAAATDALRSQIEAIAPLLGLQPAGLEDPSRRKALQRILALLRRSPRPPLALLTAQREAVEAALTEAAALLDERRERRTRLETRFTPELLKAPALEEERARFRAWASAFPLLAFLMLFFARGRLKSYLRPQQALPTNADITRHLDDAARLRELDAALLGKGEEARAVLGHLWRGADTDMQAVRDAWAWCLTFRAEANTFALLFQQHANVAALEHTLREIALEADLRLASTAPLGASAAALEGAATSWEAACDALSSHLELAEPLGESTPLDTLVERLERWAEALGQLRGWCDWQTAARAAAGLGLGPIVELLRSGAADPEAALLLTERAVRQAWIEQEAEQHPDLRAFRGERHDERIRRFQRLDEEARALARQTIQARLAARLPSPDAPGEMAVLREQFKKKRGHLPLRRLIERVPNVLLRLKPCVLASPLSVARFLEPGEQRFDLVIFDEASQIPPWDAVGALARGRQAIVVGDSRQLPPTSFFQRESEGEEGDEDDQLDLESILDQCVVAGLPSMDLRWHYRSRHEALIAFSNHHYYDRRLHIFPTALQGAEHLGVRWVPVPGGVYDKGASRTNRAEAEAVVAEVVRRLTDPELARRSIGIVTFSAAQQRCIEDMLDEQRRRVPGLDAAFQRKDEAPFIKNLESVQGDERDVMLFSIGYGPDKLGRVSMAFGPLNRPGGERRLNVAITRARELLLIFSTLRADQIDLSRTAAVGVHHLKNFLEYAERGPAALHSAATVAAEAAAFESPFEEQVARKLQHHGWTVHPQVGVAGYRIDLGVQDPHRPGAYLLGVECDGATYHSARTARDRDRLRQGVLESLGWSIHRIWSTDWWHDPQPLLRALLDRLQQLAEESERQLHEPPKLTAPAPELRADLPPAAAVSFDILPAVAPSRPTEATPWAGLPALPCAEGDPYNAASLPTLQAQLRVAAQAAPILLSSVSTSFALAWGMKQSSAKLLQRLRDVAAATPRLRLDGDTLWRDDQPPLTPGAFRYPAPELAPPRSLNEIPPAEAAAALAWIVGRAVALTEDEATAALVTTFGGQRVSKAAREAAAAALQAAEAAGWVAQAPDGLLVHPRDLPD